MTKAESLTTLAAWADLTRRSDDPLGYFSDPGAEAIAARSHGLAAVRATRSIEPALADVYVLGVSVTASRESRLAFRAALNAVGLKTL
jgi:hypothetical protein